MLTYILISLIVSFSQAQFSENKNLAKIRISKIRSHHVYPPRIPPPRAKPMPHIDDILSNDTKHYNDEKQARKNLFMEIEVSPKTNFSSKQKPSTTDWLLSKMLYHWNKKSPTIMLLNLCKKAAIAMHYRWQDRAIHLIKNCNKLISSRRKQLRRQIAGDFYEQKLRILKRTSRSVNSKKSEYKKFGHYGC